MNTFVLTDLASDLWVESFEHGPGISGLEAARRWSVRKRLLRGGRRDGVDLILVDNGALSFSVIPTRGMGLWKGSYEGNRLGWDSPVADGPVNPAFVNLSGLGGLGWLDGFDELLARCGLAWSGAPFEVKARKPDGSESNTTHGLHGKIANIPASYVAVHIGDQPPHEIVVEGHVEESHLFGPQVRMITRISTAPGSNRLTVRDEFVNLKDQPVDMQVLYHWNFGPPFLGAGAPFLAPIATLVPRDARAVEGLAGHDVYGSPEPGSTEQVYFYDLLGRSRGGRRDSGHAPRPRRRPRGRPPLPSRPASLLHTLEKHGRAARRLCDGAGAGHQLSQPPPVREGSWARGDTSGRRPLRDRDGAGSPHDARRRRRRRVRGRAAPVPGQADDPCRPEGAVRARGLIFLNVAHCPNKDPVLPLSPPQ